MGRATRLGALACAAFVAACSSFKDGAAGQDGGTDGPSADTAAVDAPTDAPTLDAKPAHDATVDAAHDAEAGTTTGQDSATGDMDAGGGLQVLADNLVQSLLVIVDDTNVYFYDEGGNGTVYQCPKTGCGGAPIVLGTVEATALAVDGQDVYWNDFAGGAIDACSIGGCQNQPKVIAASQPSAEGVAFDGTNLYWPSSGTIWTCVPPTCAPISAVAKNQPTSIVLLAAETDAVYWLASGSVESCPATGCPLAPTTIATGASGDAVVVKNGTAYFTVGNSVVSCPASGCTTPHTIGASDDPYGLATDGVSIYWIDDIDEAIYSCPVTGCSGSASHFATNQLVEQGANIAVDGEYVYWTNGAQVVRQHK